MNSKMFKSVEVQQTADSYAVVVILWRDKIKKILGKSIAFFPPQPNLQLKYFAFVAYFSGISFFKIIQKV